MKVFKKLLVLLLVVTLLFGCDKKENPVENDTPQETNTTQKNETNENETGKNINDEDLKEVKELYFNLYKKLFAEGNEIYSRVRVDKYKTSDNNYFVSLSQLRDDFDYDISEFKSEDGTVCDTELSGLTFIFDSGIKNDKGDDVFYTSVLTGCTKDEVRSGNE